jgi:PAS domain S-box-containing protein
VENSPTGIFIYRDGQFLFVNPRFAELLEYPRDDLLQIDPWRLVHPDQREQVAGFARKRVAQEPVPEEYECRLLTRTGQVRWVAMRNMLIRYRGGPAVLGNVQDVTERKRMENEVHLLSARLLRVQEEERRRLARDLHDSLGQKLTGIKFLIEASLGPLWSNERRAGVLALRQLIPTIQDAVEEVRRISTELRPSILDDLGLLPTIRWHLREFEKARPKLVVDQRLRATESEVPDSLRTPIYRLLQEATSNVAKHSRASRMVVGLETTRRGLRLWVEDDGVGFDPAALVRAPGGGIGMGSMRERTEFSGGVFSVESSPGAGTRVCAEWPMEPPLSG